MTDQPFATAALRDWPCTDARHLGLCCDSHVHADHVVRKPTWPNDWYDGSLAAFEPKPLAETDPGV